MVKETTVAVTVAAMVVTVAVALPIWVAAAMEHRSSLGTPTTSPSARSVASPTMRLQIAGTTMTSPTRARPTPR